MFGTTYYHSLIKKYVTLFGTLFNDIWINRTDGDGNTKHSLKIPLSYSPREQFLARIQGNPELTKPFSIVLPRMGFEIDSITYAPDRKLPTINKFKKVDYSTNEDVRKYQYNPVPYDITFTLSIFVKNTEDGTMIVEQILPYFTPEWTTTVQLISDPNITLDIPLILNSVSQSDNYEISFEDRRIQIWDLNFTMKGFFFGPTKRQGVIKLANVNFMDATLFDEIIDAVGNVDPIARVTVYPGQDANGNATTDANNTVDKSEISKDENWNYIVDIDDPL